MTASPPEPLADHHDVDGFDCGTGSLDDWLKRRALASQASGAARTFVVTENGRVVAYYALASGSARVTEAPGAFRRNMPDPIPVVILGRLAIDTQWQGRGIGRALVRDAAKRVLAAGEAIGIRGIIVHALSDQARAFYLALGFQPSPVQPMTLLVSLAQVSASL